ncbi:penicillin-binding protein activator [Allosphingosinicella flava]|uniref:Penicillin-binding protein activator n=1 Tax=Allosphingosinicella flava TaxID=2771430 RepID=A0A7T2GJZ2_9SPHN|nr:penicillin-binding protein activator [Sphingosinicella flava]QPQ55265.1 penicillin-binding protein activator [Sphingosinicella flava]
MADQSRNPQARRSFLKGAGAGLITLALAACQVVPKEPRGPVPPPRTEEGPRLPAEETRNRVAVLVPLTGENAGVGTSIANAANLALLDTGGERIRITVYDTGKGAALAANQALAEGNGLILGPLLSEDVRAVAPIARAVGVPVISFSNDAGVAGDGVYVMGFTPTQSVRRVVSFARERGVQRFAAIVPDGVYGQRAGQAMIDAVKASGGRLVAMQNFNRTPASLRAAIRTLNGQGNYDAVLIADGGRIAVAAAPQIKAGPSKNARILGTELWSTDRDLYKTAALRGAWFAAPADTLFTQFATRYRARYGKTPYRLGSLGYDAVLLAVRIASDWRLGRPFPARDLLSTEGFTGVDGAFRFTRDGTAERMLSVQEVNASGTASVSPAPKGFGD